MIAVRVAKKRPTFMVICGLSQTEGCSDPNAGRLLYYHDTNYTVLLHVMNVDVLDIVRKNVSEKEDVSG